MLNHKSILVTGGTGSFGRKFTEMLLSEYPDMRRLVIYSRDELKQFEMARQYPHDKYPMIRFFIGDVRDKERLIRACEGIEVIIHAAALKQVPIAEYNPDECIKTNIGGAQNIIEAAFAQNIKVVIALSTDKAAAPISLYGASKLVSDKLFIAANNIKGKRDMRFSVVRYGNVMGSRGSVIPYFLEQAKEGVLPLTHKDMTRFNISLEEGVRMVLWVFQNAKGGEIFVPKIPSFKLHTLAEAIAPKAKLKYIGLRAGEKIHEEMITRSDSYNTIDIGKYYVILPNNYLKEEYLKYYPGSKEVEAEFSYNSGTNTEWITVQQMRELIKKYIDPNFKPIE